LILNILPDVGCRFACGGSENMGAVVAGFGLVLGAKIVVDKRKIDPAGDVVLDRLVRPIRQNIGPKHQNAGGQNPEDGRNPQRGKQPGTPQFIKPGGRRIGPILPNQLAAGGGFLVGLHHKS
jgi:hypothetical protein